MFAALQETLRKRILGFLVRHGILDSLDADDMLQWDHGGGFSLHGAVRIDEWDRLGQEKLLRYCARPAFALERLARWDDERLVYQFQRPLPDGQTCQVFSPMELMKRLAELIPPPWMNLVRYYGVLAPHAKLREKVVMLAGPSEALRIRLQEAAENMGIEQNRKETPEPNSQENESTTRKRASVCWAILMARIFELLPLQCPRCGHPMKIVGFIMEPSNVNKVLEHLELPTETPVAHPPRPPPQTEMEFADDS